MKKILALVLALVMTLSLASVAMADTYKIGMVTDVGGVNDKSFNQTTWEGLQALAAEDANVQVAYLESATDADYSANIETFIDEEYDLIICVGYMLATATREAAEAYPEQKFAIIDDNTCADLPNVACLMFAQEEASFLVGVVAGMTTKSNVVGYVQGMVSESMNRFAVGYIAGVKYANPEATILQYNANAFGDATVGSAAATDMITNGADVIYHAAGGTGNGVIEACNTNKVWAIGVDTDQSPLAPDVVITSAMKRVDVAAQDVSKSVINGTYAGGEYLYELTNGGVDLSPTTTLLSEEILTAVEAVKAGIIAGEIKVPALPEELSDPALFTLK